MKRDDSGSSASSHTQGRETDGGKHEGVHDAPQNHAWGVFYTPQEHFEAAKELEHPATTASFIPDVLRRNIFELATLGSQEIARRRKTALNQIVDMAEQIPLQPEPEYETSHVFDITKLKHLPLFRKLLEDTQFPDMDVRRALEEGVALVSPTEADGTPPGTLRIEGIKVQRLGRSAVWRPGMHNGMELRD